MIGLTLVSHCPSCSRPIAGIVTPLLPEEELALVAATEDTIEGIAELFGAQIALRQIRMLCFSRSSLTCTCGGVVKLAGAWGIRDT
ncbi:MAG: hypothetical protein WBB76_04840 [Gaiellaceae bacterium]